MASPSASSFLAIMSLSILIMSVCKIKISIVHNDLGVNLKIVQNQPKMKAVMSALKPKPFKHLFSTSNFTSRQMSENSRWRQMSGDECLKIHVGINCHLMSNDTCLIVVKCLWCQSSQPLTGLRGPASKVLATNVIGIKELESNNI